MSAGHCEIPARIAGASTPSSSAAPIETGTISGVENVYVSVVEAAPQTSDDVSTGMTQAAVRTMIDRLNSYWSTQSNGMVSVDLGGYETDSLDESTCSPNDVLNAEESDAFGGMFADDAWQGTHNHLLVLSTESCDSESFATVGGGGGGEIFSGNGISASLGVEYLPHEFGHNLGFEHADASICTNTRSYDATAGSAPVTGTLTALSGSGGTQALEIVDPISGDVGLHDLRAGQQQIDRRRAHSPLHPVRERRRKRHERHGHRAHRGIDR